MTTTQSFTDVIRGMQAVCKNLLHSLLTAILLLGVLYALFGVGASVLCLVTGGAALHLILHALFPFMTPQAVNVPEWNQAMRCVTLTSFSVLSLISFGSGVLLAAILYESDWIPLDLLPFWLLTITGAQFFAVSWTVIPFLRDLLAK